MASPIARVLGQTGINVMTRLIGLILAALDPLVSDPAQHVVAFRSFQTMTFVVKRAPFTAEEIARVLAEAEYAEAAMLAAYRETYGTAMGGRTLP